MLRPLDNFDADENDFVYMCMNSYSILIHFHIDVLILGMIYAIAKEVYCVRCTCTMEELNPLRHFKINWKQTYPPPGDHKSTYNCHSAMIVC